MILYFLRHGVAGNREEWKGDDALRPLTKKGMKSMVSQAKAIDAMDLKLDLIVTSPLARAFQTADIVADELDMGDKLVQDERLGPGFGGDDLVGVLQGYPDASNILLVGHEPDFSQTISALIGGGRILVKKGGLARVDMINTDPLQGELVWLLPPRLMTR
jgi:phosphohistidine phosphatase